MPVSPQQESAAARRQIELIQFSNKKKEENQMWDENREKWNAAAVRLLSQCEICTFLWLLFLLDVGQVSNL